MVIRGPNGGGVQLSAQHTHSLEGFYGHFPGLKVVSPVTPHDVKGMMIEAIRDPDPVIFLEAGALYGTKGEVPEGEFAVPFGKARIAKDGTDISLIGYGRQVNLLLRVADALDKEQISAEVIDLRSIRPFDVETIIESVKKTNRAVVVQEQWRWFSVASEVAALIKEQAFDSMDAPVERVSGAEAPAPDSKSLEAAAFPSEQDVIEAAKRVLYRKA
jgi:pyruvate dehydrogenase E1 component beta subunit